MRFARLLILDSSIRTTLGHHFEYARSVADVARRHGLETTVAVHRSVEPAVQQSLSALPAFRLGLYDHVFKRAATSTFLKRLDGICWIFVFLRDWRSSGLSRMVGPETLVFVPTAVEMTVFGLLLWLRWCPKAKRPKSVILFRFEPRRTMGLVGRLVRPLVEEKSVMLATDSEVLAEQFREITGLDFAVLPIPHLTDLRTASEPQTAPLRLLFPGGARDEKGTDLLAGALLLLEDLLAGNRIQVTVQCNIHHYEELTARALGQLEELHRRYPRNVLLVTRSLSSAEYTAMLSETNAVLVPYRRQDYRARTSGVFAEALAAGKPVVVTGGTWMSAQLARHGSGIAFERETPREFADAIVRLEREYASLAAKAHAAVPGWIALHNGEQLYRTITGNFDAAV